MYEFEHLSSSPSFCNFEKSTSLLWTSVIRNQCVYHNLIKNNTDVLSGVSYICVCLGLSVMSDCLWSHGLWSTRFLCPWNSPGKKTGVSCHFLLQGIFPTQGSNRGLPYCRQTLYHLSYQESPHYTILYIFFKFLCLLKDNCFTEFRCFLSNFNMNQP